MRTHAQNCSHKKVTYLKDTVTPNFLYCVISEQKDTVRIGWQTRNWNEITVSRNDVVFVDKES